MTNTSIYQDISVRTDGNIYIGVVGPVRTGKSTFIKRFMDTLVIPNIESVYVQERARDELPQSGSGRTIMTAEPKFVPEEAVSLTLDGSADLSVRLIDCVGYMVEGAIGEYENGEARLVTTPWFDHEVTMREAVEVGTRKVITDHSTVGLVITTDGTIGEIERGAYVEPERRVIAELKALGKPFLIVLNSAQPDSSAAKALCASLSEEYGVTCVVKNCLTLTESDINAILGLLLYEFPVFEMEVFLPPWVDALPLSHSIKSELFGALRSATENMYKISDVSYTVSALSSCETVSGPIQPKTDLGRGRVQITVDIPRSLFYKTISEQSGLVISDDGDLMTLLTDLATVKTDYDRVRSALNDVRTKGYGVVLPTKEELILQEPEIVRRGGRYGVRLKASAPSIHMIRANIETEVSPGVGGEKSSEDIISFLLQEFEGNTGKLWESNLFGKSLYDIAGEGLNAKIKRMPEESQAKLQETLQRIINEGSVGLICIII